MSGVLIFFFVRYDLFAIDYWTFVWCSSRSVCNNWEGNRKNLDLDGRVCLCFVDSVLLGEESIERFIVL